MSESKADTSAPVCVTGASGFLASELVKQLLERGYTVHGTVRSLKNPDKVDHLKKLKGADERLKLFEADLLKEESFKEPVKGCSCVFHTASPFYMENIEDPEKEMYAPAVQGTLSVLRAANEEASVSRVVLTSSTASVRPRPLLFTVSTFSSTFFSFRCTSITAHQATTTVKRTGATWPSWRSSASTTPLAKPVQRSEWLAHGWHRLSAVMTLRRR
ncbi:TKPR1 [Symbiodinium sp. KB8]|nr:TKPR1 [Symbiodinium sp. KB8]